jgi:hypothetical protein
MTVRSGQDLDHILSTMPGVSDDDMLNAAWIRN